ncbi:Thioredoxin domain-containing protein 9 [Araneus ventricosus]|uniref:Thioredoxin domain-containing protein 9 n=1 Tax=Araneus ventricosus TaxID=182803 RepID=A0A4Y2BQ33_ARAVE|nr:Thioredoxin domain-containing protein 9 [Araneus ventricosus]
MVEEQIDNEIEKLDRMEDEELQALERRRAAALKKQIKEKEQLLQQGHGAYSELANEKEFFEATKKSNNVVCHFYRSSTMRCSIVDKHLQALAPKHVETRFCKINAEKSFFLVQRLNVRVLPTIVLIKDGKTVDYIIGFDDLGGVDDFSTEMMEWRIAGARVINYSGDLSAPPGKSKKPTNPLLRYKPKTIRGGNDDSDTDTD